MRLFEDYAALNAQPTAYPWHPVAAPRAITAAMFEAWPEHMRTEFALLVQERGIKLKLVRDETGIAPADIEAALRGGAIGSLPALRGHHYDEDRPMSRQQDAAPSR